MSQEQSTPSSLDTQCFTKHWRRRSPGRTMPWGGLLGTLVLVLGSATSPGLATVTGWGGGATEPQVLDWSLAPVGCAPDPGPEGTVLACGSYGTFTLGSHGGDSCPTVEGSETPPAYVEPAAAGFSSIDPVLKRGGEAAPCPDGVCFDPPGGAGGTDPWIAVFDWNNEHGWSTGWTAKSLSGLPVHLYALDDPDLLETVGPRVGDAHLLARLCQLTELVETSQTPAPVVANLSFGRLAQPGHDSAQGASCVANNLSCQIAKLFEHLHQLGVTATAAAGNYGQVQLPAGYEVVLATGALDLASFVDQGQTVAAWETPPQSQVLMPGYGVCLETGNPTGSSLWPAPPGASYASAVLAGWLAHTLGTRPVPDPTQVDWVLDWSVDAGCFVLSRHGDAVCNPVADRLLARILGSVGNTCWGVGDTGFLDIPLDIGTVQQGVTQQLPSLVEWVDLGHVPNPESDPCVPCVSDGFTGSSPLLNDKLGRQTRPRSLVTPSSEKVSSKNGAGGPPRPQDLVVDLSASSPLRPAVTLDALHLRVGADFYAILDRQRPEQVAALDSLAAGDAGTLVVRDARRLIAADQQPSLVFVLCQGQAGCFWSSVPVLLLP